MHRPGLFWQSARKTMRKPALLLVLLLAACKSSHTDDPQRWLKGLQDSDPKARIQSVAELRRLKAKSAAPQIAALLKDPLVKEDAALALQDLGGPGEVQPLLDALGDGSDPATRKTSATIAGALGNIGDPRATPALLRLMMKSDDQVRLAALQALGQVRAREAVPELVHLVDDPAASPALIKKAIVALGQIGDPAGIVALEHGLALERQGVSFLPESSFALFLIGPVAVEPLTQIAQDKDAAWLAWARLNRISPGTTYAKVALVLGDLEDPRAIPVLLSRLKYTDPNPDPSSARALTNLVKQFSASALGRLRAREAAPLIQTFVSTTELQDEQLTAAAAEALVWIGDREQARELMKKAQSGVLKLRLIAAQSAVLFGEPALGRDLLLLASKEAKGSGAACLDQLRGLTLPVDDPKQACDLLATQFGELSLPLEAARVCAQDVPCWLPKLQDADAVVRARAAYELGRSGAPEAVAPLIRAVSDDELLVREAAIRALDWLASVEGAKSALRSGRERLGAQLTAEQGKAQYAKVNEDLRRLEVKLARLR